jgi:uncharacterized protein
MYIRMEIEWDENKNRLNQTKHGVTFKTAALVFADPLALSFPERNVEGEERWQTIGNAAGIVILTVANTLRSLDGKEVIRIISARKATPSERKRYEETD